HSVNKKVKMQFLAEKPEPTPRTPATIVERTRLAKDNEFRMSRYAGQRWKRENLISDSIGPVSFDGCDLLTDDADEWLKVHEGPMDPVPPLDSPADRVGSPCERCAAQIKGRLVGNDPVLAAARTRILGPATGTFDSLAQSLGLPTGSSLPVPERATT